MRRREFISLLGGAAAWPLAVHARQGRRVAALWPFTEGDVEGQALFAVFRQGLRELGWANVQIDSRWGGGRNLLHYCKRPAQYRLYSWVRPTRLEPDTSPVSRDRAATSPASRFTSRRLRASGWEFERSYASNGAGRSSDQSGHRDSSRNILLASVRSRCGLSKHRAHHSEGPYPGGHRNSNWVARKTTGKRTYWRLTLLAKSTATSSSRSQLSIACLPSMQSAVVQLGVD